MKSKPKIGIVAGDQKQTQIIDIFAPFRDKFDFTVFSFDHESILDSSNFGLPIKAFNEDPKMPGFMKGLEDNLSVMDAIVAIETSRLSSFQALRAARKFGIPIGVLTSEYRPYFYEKYRNIRAIQCDIYNKASRYWTLSSAATALLHLEGVAPELIHEIGPKISQIPSKSQKEKKRIKFRQYIGLDQDHMVILARFDLEAAFNTNMLMKGFSQFLKQSASSSKVRLVIVGNGLKAQEMKYYAADLGIGKYVLFIHQNPMPFFSDLLSASDLSINLCATQPECHEGFPQWVVESMSYGVIPIFESGCQELELVCSLKNFLNRFTFPSNSPESLAGVLTTYLKTHEEIEKHKQEIIDLASTFLLKPSYLDSIIADLEALMSERAHIQSNHDASTVLKSMESLFKDGQFSELICLIEEMCLRQAELGPKNLVNLLALKGDTFFHLGDLQKAEEAFRYALEIEPEDIRCLRGLGNINWQCHAHDQALTYFKKAVHKCPDDGLSCFGIGMVYARLGLGEDAIYWLERSAQVIPPAPGAMMAIAQTCASIPHTQTAIEHLCKTIENLGDHSILLLTLGQLYLTDGKEVLGNELIAKAMARRPMVA